MSINNARLSPKGLWRNSHYVSPSTPQPNRYGDRYREQIIRNTIWRARPRWFGVIGFNICPVSDAQAILNVADNDAYRVLHTYHCVGYWFIPQEIRRRIPELIREALTPETGIPVPSGDHQ